MTTYWHRSHIALNINIIIKYWIYTGDCCWGNWFHQNLWGFIPRDQPELAIFDLRTLLKPLVRGAGARDVRDVQQASQLHCHLFTRAQSFLDVLRGTINHVLSCFAPGGWFCTVEGSRVAKKVVSWRDRWTEVAVRLCPGSATQFYPGRKFPPRESPRLWGRVEELCIRPDFSSLNEPRWDLQRL